MNKKKFFRDSIVSKIKGSSLFKSAGIYTITSIINSAIPFFLLPILTRELSPMDYGIISMFGVLLSFLTPFTGLSVYGSISRMYYEREKINISEYITNCIYLMLISTGIVSLILFIFSENIAVIFDIPKYLIAIAVIASFSQYIVRIVLILWQVRVKPKKYGFFQISQTTLNMAVTLFLILILKMNWEGRIYAHILTLVSFASIGLYILFRDGWIKFNYNRKYIKHAALFGIPLIPHSLGAIVITMTDRLFISNMVGVETTGVYTVGYQIGMIISVLSTAFNQAYVPWLYSKLKENVYDVKRKIVKFTYMYFVVILFISILLSIVSPLIFKIFIGEEFAQSNIYVIWIALGYAFNGMYLMVSSYIFYSQKTKYLSIVTFMTSVLNLVLNYFFVKKYGAIGAAQSTTISYLIMFIFTWIIASRIYDMPWNLYKKFNENKI